MSTNAGYIKGAILVVLGLFCLLVGLDQKLDGAFIAASILLVGGFYAPTISAIRIALQDKNSRD